MPELYPVILQEKRVRCSGLSHGMDSLALHMRHCADGLRQWSAFNGLRISTRPHVAAHRDSAAC
jgi:hypothetical protein